MSSSVTIPAGSVVLVSGATGFVATHVIGNFLKRGYKVRGTVRDLASSSWLVDEKHFKSYADSGDFELVVVPDISAIDAFDEAVKGVSAIAHLATVLTFDPNPENVIPQTVSGVTSVLTAAAKEPSVREVVVTSSIVASIMPVGTKDHRPDTVVDRNTWNESAVQAAWAPPPYEPSRPMMTYAASKIAAEKEVWRFMNEIKPQFTINVVAPSGIIGQPLHQKHVDKPGNWVKSLFEGDKQTLDTAFGSFFVDVEDIALLHVGSILDPKIKNARLHAWGHSANWNDFLVVLRELRPKKDFIADWPDYYHLRISTDQSQSVALLKKWGTLGGWKPLRDSLLETVESPYFQLE
ncbi:hypothetical protein BGZ60DRAFT_467685 [Tricladium varicosporioides]|nr:hypothetical protein BGZ60DRAFT_467685 [Hymenoscyphus varicosporioides]